MPLRLDTPVGRLKGVGSEVERKLAKLGIESIGDLIKHYPRRYDDFSRIVPIRSARPGLITVRGTILRVASRRARSRNMTITEAVLSDDTGTIKAVWFNQPYLKRQLVVGGHFFLSGKLEFKYSDMALQSPAVEPINGRELQAGHIVPVYPETEGLSSRQLRGIMAPLIPELSELPENLPAEVVKTAKLIPYGEALAELHAPTSPAKLKKAHHRLAFEELWYIIAASVVIKHEIMTEVAPVISFQPDMAKRFVAALDFRLTDAQRKAAWEILQDLGRPFPMNRLLEGDVGSGKTVVALMAAHMTLAAGFQAALMVPTEVLARQHFAKITPLMNELGYQTELIVGGGKADVRRAAKEAAAGGAAHLLIGTHALLSGDVKFDNLGLVIIDEQHRFGVNQRLALKDKAGRLPHLLSMTATPIPRSLQLTVYGDLDVSIINSLPPGRRQILTKIVEPRERDKTYDFVDQQIEQGRQVFVVCPLIDPSDQLGARSVTAEAERLSRTVFSHRRLGVMHGRLKAEEKQATMEAFIAGELDILVATSVIEVGVDIPNATIMLIEGAERFGLAALHQLRGRVGRGKHQSYCFLAPSNAVDNQRLVALEKTNDGFRLAQIDLELRGPGQIYGLRQHGDLELELADFTDVKLVSQVRQSVESFVGDPALMVKYPQVVARINTLKAVTSLD